MNKIHRVIWNEVSGTFVAVAEIAKARGKRASTGTGGSVASAFLLRPLTLAFLSMGLAQAAPPAPTELPTGGQIVAGQASISQSSGVMNIHQGGPRAAIDWNTFNVGSQAQVNFQQPSSTAAILNRVNDANPSQIFGRINANGQVFLTNANGVYFSPSASANVGALTATTHSISNADFMAGNYRFSRDGATGKVINEGRLTAQLQGYIALLAPEVRNQGVIVARMGTVALAAGETYELQFDEGRLTNIRVEPATIATLVENGNAIQAPGGLIILSAQAVDRLQGGVVRNTGTLEATGLMMRNGKIVLHASGRVENSGSIRADAGSDGSPAGVVSITAPVVENRGVISAQAHVPVETLSIPVPAAPAVGGSIEITASRYVQDSAARLDVSATEQGGTVQVRASAELNLAGQVDTGADEGAGGEISLISAGDVTLRSARVDASGATRGGRIHVLTATPTEPADLPQPDRPQPTVALLESSLLRSSSRRGRGGEVTVTGRRVGLFDSAQIDVSGATGGGLARVGGDYQGGNPEVTNAEATYIAAGAVLRADALETGQGGRVIVWADGVTRFQGAISARGGALGGDGGFVEVSGKGLLDFQGTVDTRAPLGQAGTLLLDPYNLTISSAADTSVSGSSPFDATGTGSVLNTTTLENALAAGNVIVTTGSSGGEAGDITLASDIAWIKAYSLTLQAHRHININANLFAFQGGLTLTAGQGDASGAITLGNGIQVNLISGSLIASAGGSISEAAGGSQGYFQVAGTASFTSTNGSITLGATSNKFTGALSLDSGDAGSITVYNNLATHLGSVSAGSGGISLTSNGHLTGSATFASTGAVSLATATDSEGNITLSGAFTASGAVSLAADGAGGVSVANIDGPLTLAYASGGGAITLGNIDTGVLTLDAADGNVIEGNDGPAGQASGTVTLTGSAIAINDPIRTRGGNLVITARSGTVNTVSGAHLTTTADADTGTASGSITVTAATGIALQNITSSGADNAVGVGSNAAPVTLTATAGDISVGAITTSGGDADAGATSNRNGGNAGNISLSAGAGTLYLSGDLSAIGGDFVGAATQGLGGYIETLTPAVLNATILVTSGATSGNVYFLASVDSDSTPRTLTVTSGTGDVKFDGVVGGVAPLASLTVTTSYRTDIEKNVTTNAAAGIAITATSSTRIGDDDFANGSGTVALNTLAGDGAVSFTTPNIYLDDAVTFTRGSRAIDISAVLSSNSGERNHLTFDGAGGGAVTIGATLGGSSLGAASALGNILLSSVTDLTIGGSISASSLISLNSTGRLQLSNSGSQFYDGALGLQLATTGTATTHTNDQNIVLDSNVTLSNATAPISITAHNGSFTHSNYRNLTSAGGQISLSAIGVTQGSTSGLTGIINAGSGKIRVDGNGGRILMYGTLVSTNADSDDTSAILLQDAYVANAGDGAVWVRSVTATSGTLEIGQVVGTADVRGDVRQYDSGVSNTDSINIKTLKIASTGSISISDTSNIIDELGTMVLGGSLTVEAKGRTTGMALTGDVSATAVTIKTGQTVTSGILSLGTRDITATSGDIFLQGRGITQSAGSDIYAKGYVTIYGSDYASEGNRGNVIMAGTLRSDITNNNNAVTFADLDTLTLPDITIGTALARGGLRLGTHDHNGSAFRRVYGVITQTADTALRTGNLDIRQNSGSGVVTLFNTSNEIQNVSYVERGGAISLYDKDSDGNGLSMSEMTGGSYDSLLTATTEGRMTISGTNYSKGMTLVAGAAGFTGSGSIQGHHGGAGLISITTTGSLALTGGTMYAKGIQLTSGAAGITSATDLQAHHSGGADMILDAGGGDITLTNRLYLSGTGNDIFIRNADDLQLENVEIHNGKIELGGVGTGVGGADEPLTGNVTQTGRIYSGSDIVNLTGAVSGTVTLNNTNQIYRVGDFSSGGNFSFKNQDRALILEGAISSATGDITVHSTNNSLSLTGSLTAADGGILLRAASSSALTLGGNLTAGSEGIALTAGTSITQSGGVIVTPGRVWGPNQSGTAPTAGTASSEGNPSAKGNVLLTRDNEIGSFGPFYVNAAASTLTVNDISGGLVLDGSLWTSHGAVTLTTVGGALAMGNNNITAGDLGTGNNISLTGRGITQTSGITSANKSDDTSGGTITFTGHDGIAAGAIELGGTLETANASASAVKIRGTASLVLPNITAPNGTLVLGDATADIGVISGPITQSAGTALNLKTLEIGTSSVPVGSSAILANSGNTIVQLASINVSDNAGVTYDLDVVDSTSGLTLTQTLTSAGGIRLRTATGGGAAGILALGSQDVLAEDDIFLGGDGVTQSTASSVDADNAGLAATGGSIRIDGGGLTNNIALNGSVSTDNAGATAIEIVDATNATLNVISASAGTVTLGVSGEALTGTVSQVATTGIISAATLKGNAGVVTITQSNLDNLGDFTATGAMTLLDQGGAGTDGLLFTGNVTVGSTTEIQTTDGLLDLDTYTLNAAGQGVTLRGVAITQEASSAILGDFFQS